MFLNQRWFRRWDGKIINETEVKNSFELCSGLSSAHSVRELACHIHHLIEMGRMNEIPYPSWEDFLYSGQEVTAICRYREDNPGMPLGTAKAYILDKKNELVLEGKI